MLDVLGRVHLVPPQFVEVLRKPRLSDDELNALDENEALGLLVKQGEDEESIIAYVRRRSEAQSQNGVL